MSYDQIKYCTTSGWRARNNKCTESYYDFEKNKLILLAFPLNVRSFVEVGAEIYYIDETPNDFLVDSARAL